MHQRTFFAFAGDDNLTVFTAFERCFEAIEPKIGFVTLRTVTPETGRLKDGAHVFGISHVLCRRSWRQFADVWPGGGSGNDRNHKGTHGERHSTHIA